MKKTVFLLCLLTLAAFGAGNRFTVGDGKVPDVSKYRRLRATLRSHPREIRTDYSIPGRIIHFFSDGTVTTNDVVRIDAIIVTNTVERKIDSLEQLNVALSNQVVKAVELFGQMSNRWASVSAKFEAARTGNQSAVEKLEELKKKAPLLTSLIDKIEDLVRIQEVSE